MTMDDWQPVPQIVAEVVILSEDKSIYLFAASGAVLVVVIIIACLVYFGLKPRKSGREMRSRRKRALSAKSPL